MKEFEPEVQPPVAGLEDMDDYEPSICPEEGPSPVSPMEDQNDQENRGQVREREEGGEDHPTKRHRAEYVEILYAKVESLAKQRARKEVSMRKENDPERAKFQKAITKEIKNNFTSKAYELISLKESEQVRREKADKVMKSRYVLTRKPCEPEDIAPAQAEGILLDDETDGPHKAKARHVMQGYSENGSEELDSTTPQVAKDSVIFTLQILCSMGWEIGNLDFTQAFHSGDPIERELYCEQPKEGVPGAQPRQLLRLLKTCYGLTDGPYAWYKHVTKVLKGLGYVQSLADPCMFYLYAEDELSAGRGEDAKVSRGDTECHSLFLLFRGLFYIQGFGIMPLLQVAQTPKMLILQLLLRWQLHASTGHGLGLEQTNASTSHVLPESQQVRKHKPMTVTVAISKNLSHVKSSNPTNLMHNILYVCIRLHLFMVFSR